MTIWEFEKTLEEKRKVEKLLEIITQNLKEGLKQLGAGLFDPFDYESAKKLYKEVQPYIQEDEMKKEISKKLKEKKIQKYPKLLKPTYYPQIDSLDISDSEKLRLDYAARANVRYYISESNLDRLTTPISIQDLELLRTIGIVEKKYNFKCEECMCSIRLLSEEDIKKYKRVWELEGLKNQISKEQDEELEKLYEDGYFSIHLCCLDDEEFDVEITNEQELEEYPYVETVYKVVVAPDLTYEKL